MIASGFRRAAVLGGLTAATVAASMGVASADAATAKPAPVKKFDVCYPKAAHCATAKHLKVRAYGTVQYRPSYPAGHVTAYNKTGKTAYVVVTIRMKNGVSRTKYIPVIKRINNVGFSYPASSRFITSITIKACTSIGPKAPCGLPQTLVTPKLG
ncbi:hypothetical protein [Actinomadura rupiterrae]|uniref:hypothetical protein n=1 Tax=Actinomadura rupiterrae TaxID=559627 RepID=UPI0020A42851|nr:hypothetical protein [Actinomadura rupiterrae]MCP2343008.1 hypothetical protein [Actinomadura rupiterrae]